MGVGPQYGFRYKETYSNPTRYHSYNETIQLILYFSGNGAQILQFSLLFLA